MPSHRNTTRTFHDPSLDDSYVPSDPCGLRGSERRFRTLGADLGRRIRKLFLEELVTADGGSRFLELILLAEASPELVVLHLPSQRKLLGVACITAKPYR